MGDGWGSRKNEPGRNGRYHTSHFVLPTSDFILTAILTSHTFALLAANDGCAALLAAADRAMYQAKRGSCGAIRFATSPAGPRAAKKIAG